MLCFVIMLIAFSCLGLSSKEECLNDYMKKIYSKREYLEIRQAAKDTVTNWSNMNIDSYFKIDNKTEDWQLDTTVVFNKEMSKALLLILAKDKKPTAKADYVQLIAAEIRENRWHFYVQTMPTLYFSKSQRESGGSHSFDELSKLGWTELIGGGLYDRGTCNLNSNYINDWFKDPLHEFHQKYFLGRKVK